MKKYEQVNVITLIAMFMIATIHYFNYFVGDFVMAGSQFIVPFLRGFAIIAVPLFVANIGFSNLFCNKRINFEKLVLYIIIPTIIFTYINHILYDTVEVYFNLKEGFSGSWFGDMYIGLMLFIPLVTYYYHKNKVATFIVGILLSFFGYFLSISWGSATLMDLGLFVFIPYIGMLVVLTYLIFEIKKPPNIILISMLIICIIFEALAYSGVFEFSRFIVTSYFSPVTYLFTYSLFSLVYNSDFKIKNLRNFTQTSYFYYFTSYIVLRYIRAFQIDFVTEYSALSYLVVVTASGVLSYISFILYRKTLNVLKIES